MLCGNSRPRLFCAAMKEGILLSAECSELLEIKKVSEFIHYCKLIHAKRMVLRAFIYLSQFPLSHRLSMCQALFITRVPAFVSPFA